MNTINDTIELGAQLRLARKQLGLTQPQLALATGVGVRFIVDLEAGKPTVQLALVLRVVDALGGNMALIGLPEAAANNPSANSGENPSKNSDENPSQNPRQNFSEHKHNSATDD